MYLKSTTTKSLLLFISVGCFLMLMMEATNYHYYYVYQKNILENYKDSFSHYCSVWDSNLGKISEELLEVVYDDNLAFWNVTHMDKGLEYETGKIQLLNSLRDIMESYGESIHTFAYFPEKQLYLKNNSWLYDDFYGYLCQYNDLEKKSNEPKWNHIKINENHYFVQIYYAQDGYIGAAVNCCDVLPDSIGNGDFRYKVSLVNGNPKNVENIFLMGENIKSDVDFNIPMSNINSTIQFGILDDNVDGARESIFVNLFVTFAIGVTLIIYNIIYMNRHLLKPIRKLKNAMLCFKDGDLNVRIPNEENGRDVEILYGTFNEMAEQIGKLKIEVYEAELEREKINSNYLRLQIQPHFYANIVYGLAEFHRYDAIKELTVTTGNYFRYLIGNKGTFVTVEEEEKCVINYLRIQKIRYEESLEYDIETVPELKKQMIIPLVLQTFVENSVKHNISLVPVLRVSVYNFLEGDNIHLIIRDNGVGFPEDILLKINNNESIENNGNRIGIMNVKQRLRHLYGNKAGFRILSNAGATEVEVILPCLDR